MFIDQVLFFNQKSVFLQIFTHSLNRSVPVFFIFKLSAIHTRVNGIHFFLGGGG
jgi:hypothetical protein